MTEFQFQLEGNSKKHPCPQCGQKRLVRYVDQQGQYLPDEYGRCDREQSCGYHVKPSRTNSYHPVPIAPSTSSTTGTRGTSSTTGTSSTNSTVPVKIFKASRTGYNQNYLVQWLTTSFNTDIATELIRRYHIGTSKHWPGSTVFWQIDRKGKIRSGKIMLYNPGTGKRVKEPFNHVTWVHKALKLPDFRLKQCLFGEHLLNDTGRKIAIVESEKTAILASVYIPSLIWLACGSLTGLTSKKCEALEGRTVTVILFPDLGAFEKWQNRADELNRKITGARFVVSDFLEKHSTEQEKQQGLDLADYLTRFDWQKFQVKALTDGADQMNTSKQIQPSVRAKVDALLAEVETAYQSRQLDGIPAMLTQCLELIQTNRDEFTNDEINFCSRELQSVLNDHNDRVGTNTAQPKQSQELLKRLRKFYDNIIDSLGSGLFEPCVHKCDSPEQANEFGPLLDSMLPKKWDRPGSNHLTVSIVRETELHVHSITFVRQQHDVSSQTETGYRPRRREFDADFSQQIHEAGQQKTREFLEQIGLPERLKGDGPVEIEKICP